MNVATPYLVSWITGVESVDLEQLNRESPQIEITAALLWQGFFSIGIFLIPALLFAYQTTPHMRQYLGLRKPGNALQWLLSAVIMLGAIPVMLQIHALMRNFDFGADAAALQATNDRMTQAFLSMPSVADFFLVFLIMAIVPAIGEELFFRGIIMRFMAKRQSRLALQRQPAAKSANRAMLVSIIVTAVFFALMHSTLYGFISIFLAGVILGLIYYLTGSIWCSILAHLINNGLQIVLVYLSEEQTPVQQSVEESLLPWGWVIAGLIIGTAALTILWKNRTPLAPGWTDDYLAEELQEEEQTL